MFFCVREAFSSPTRDPHLGNVFTLLVGCLRVSVMTAWSAAGFKTCPCACQHPVLGFLDHCLDMYAAGKCKYVTRLLGRKGGAMSFFVRVAVSVWVYTSQDGTRKEGGREEGPREGKETNFRLNSQLDSWKGGVAPSSAFCWMTLL